MNIERFELFFRIEECVTLPEVAEAVIQVKELLCSPDVVNGGDKGEMGDDLVVEAKCELSIGGVTHRFLLALGSDDPERNQNMYWWTNLPDEEDEGMDAERRRHP